MPIHAHHLAAVCVAMSSSAAWAAPIYLGQSRVTVSVGEGTSPGSFNNTFAAGNTIDKVIDAPSADAEEFHSQTTHVWFTAAEVGGGLELLFDFDQEYDISTLHFWNYTGEGFDVDEVDFTFFDASAAEVGNLTVMPELGTAPGITAQDIPLAAPLNVQSVNALLTGSNGQVDFQNIGFTAEVSAPSPTPTPVPPGPMPQAPAHIPLPAGLPLLAAALGGLAILRRRAAN